MSLKIPDFIIIPSPLLFDKNLTPLDRVVYGVIYWIVCLKGEKCFLSNRALKEITGIKNQKTISNCLSRLERRGYIKRVFNENKREEIVPLVRMGYPSNNGWCPSDNGGGPSNNGHFPKNFSGESENNDITNKSILTQQSIYYHDSSNISTKYYKHQENIKNISLTGKEINELIAVWKEVNPDFERFFKIKREREAVENLAKKLGKEKYIKLVRSLRISNQKKYFPIITTPSQLEKNLAKLLYAWQREKRSSKIVEI